MSSKLWFRFLFSIVLLTLLISSCDAAPSGGTYVWIDVPLDGLSFPDIHPVTIEGHATGPEGVSHVELYVDGDLWNTIEDPPAEGNLASFQAEWTPPSAGRYTIHAIAYGNDGTSSQYDETRISFGEETPTPEITDTPAPEEPIEPPPPEEGSIQFWAEPEMFQAGGCTTLYWQTENVQQVVFGGVEQPFEGSYQACLCKNQRYTHHHRIEHKVGNRKRTAYTQHLSKDGVVAPKPVKNNLTLFSLSCLCIHWSCSRAVMASRHLVRSSLISFSSLAHVWVAPVMACTWLSPSSGEPVANQLPANISISKMST